MTTSFSRIAHLPLTVDGYALEGLARAWSPEFTRRSTVVHLLGEGHEGVGEDVTYTPADQVRFQADGWSLPLTGRFTLASFSARLDELELFSQAPERADSRRYRRWAFEAAALDLALQQSGLSLADALDRELAPLHFVVSMRLPEPASAEPVLRRLELYPDMRFKLDVAGSWDEALIARLAETGAIECVDFKGHYDGLPVDTGVAPSVYRLVAEGLPEAWLEDPALTPDTSPALADHRARITWDAPITSVADIQALPERPQMVNVKPSRFGTVQALLDAYDHLAEERIAGYGGGQFELGPGRGQMQYLAALFHADAPNDVAPIAHHAIEPDLQTSPLDPPNGHVGFQWDSTRVTAAAVPCCAPSESETCCAPSAKSACCGQTATTGTCGCR